jgi:hypothetical protein
MTVPWRVKEAIMPAKAMSEAPFIAESYMLPGVELMPSVELG